MSFTSPPPMHHGNATSPHKNATTRRNGRRLVHTKTSVWRCLAYSFFLFETSAPGLPGYTSFYRSLGHPRWVCDSYRLNGSCGPYKPTCSLCGFRIFWAILSSRSANIKIYERVMPNTHLHKILISVQTKPDRATDPGG